MVWRLEFVPISMYYVLIFLLGVCIGSFLNAAIFRVHEDKSVWKGRSKCMKCEEPISWYDLVPVLSYLRLRGRCRKCKSVIDWQYPIIEIVTGLFFLIAFAVSPDNLFLVVRNWIFISYLVIIFVYDLRYMYILDRFTIPAIIIAVIINLWIGVVPAWSILLGAFVLGGFFFLQYVISKGVWIGGGDIRMGALMGFMLGFEQGLVAIFLAYVIGATISIFLLMSGKASRKTPIPFGTFLTLSTLIVLFVGKDLLHWYLSFLYSL